MACAVADGHLCPTSHLLSQRGGHIKGAAPCNVGSALRGDRPCSAPAREVTVLNWSGSRRGRRCSSRLRLLLPRASLRIATVCGWQSEEASSEAIAVSVALEQQLFQRKRPVPSTTFLPSACTWGGLHLPPSAAAHSPPPLCAAAASQPDAGSAPRGPVGPAAGEAEALPGAALASVAGAAAVEPTELAMAAAASTEVAASEASEASEAEEAEEAERLPAQSGSSSSGRSRRWQMQLLQSQGRL